MNASKRILCFGDSLTWGWVPVIQGAPSTRYPYAQRWTGAMAIELGHDFEVVEEGLSARTTDVDDPIDPRLNGSLYLPSALASHLPLDLAIVMLGTNDTKACFDRSPYQIAAGVSRLLRQIATSAGGYGTTYPAPQVLLVAPPPLGEIRVPFLRGAFEGAQAKSRELAGHYRDLADFFGVGFIDAAEHITTDGVDGIHLSAEANITLGAAIAARVRAIL